MAKPRRQTPTPSPDRLPAFPPGVLPDDLYIEPRSSPRTGRPPKHDVASWTVTDDWSEKVPVTKAEVDVFEAWFGDLFDQFFGPCR